jgi:hypothetical protein
LSYSEYIHSIKRCYDAILVKISDVEDNLLYRRLCSLAEPDRVKFENRYNCARDSLLEALYKEGSMQNEVCVLPEEYNEFEESLLENDENSEIPENDVTFCFYRF